MVLVVALFKSVTSSALPILRVDLALDRPRSMNRAGNALAESVVDEPSGMYLGNEFAICPERDRLFRVTHRTDPVAHDARRVLRFFDGSSSRAQDDRPNFNARASKLNRIMFMS